MSIRPFRDIKRKLKRLNIGNVKIGGDNPISCSIYDKYFKQNYKETLKQIIKISKEGADIS